MTRNNIPSRPHVSSALVTLSQESSRTIRPNQDKEPTQPPNSNLIECGSLLDILVGILLRPSKTRTRGLLKQAYDPLMTMKFPKALNCRSPPAVTKPAAMSRRVKNQICSNKWKPYSFPKCNLPTLVLRCFKFLDLFSFGMHLRRVSLLSWWGYSATSVGNIA